MANNARGIHSSPGIYTREIDLDYTTKSLGLTSLGVVGETLKGPAFQPINVSRWSEFKSIFGGKSPKKFNGSQYPQYELPYIAESFLKESSDMTVVRVLGLSGENLGPAWAITANNSSTGKKQVVAVLRSRGSYSAYNNKVANDGTCSCNSTNYDNLVFNVGETAATDASECSKPKHYNMDALALAPYTSIYSTGNECVDYSLSGEVADFTINVNNYGKFNIVGITGAHADGTKALESYSAGTDSTVFSYSVSLNPADKEYILNVLGTSPSTNLDVPIYVETLYDIALQQGIEDSSLTAINGEFEKYQVYYTSEFNGLSPVADIISVAEDALTKRYVGLRYVADKKAASGDTLDGTLPISVHSYDYSTGKPEKDNDGNLKVGAVEIGRIYTVAQYTDASGKRHYYYAYNSDESVQAYIDDFKEKNPSAELATAPLFDKLVDSNDYAASGSGTTISAVGAFLVRNESDDMYYRLVGNGDDKDIDFVSCDLNNYKSSYRYSSTPWIVSNAKGDYNKMEVNKLFRFHTISDGKDSAMEVKVSIEDIKPDDGTFTVVIRDYNDTDTTVSVLEKYSNCTMEVGATNYIGYKIGTFDGTYESKSSYVTVEVNTSTNAQLSVPAGFLGYPQQSYSGLQATDWADSHANVQQPELRYNLSYMEDIKDKRQYFGLSSWVGIDSDFFTFKGNAAYVDSVPSLLTGGFHLDSRLGESSFSDTGVQHKVLVDGVEGYTFNTVNQNTRTKTLTEIPIIGTEEQMYGSIFEKTALRKFCVCFYGGFDGWDEFRDARTNTDDYKYSNYKGQINDSSFNGYAFDIIAAPAGLKIDGNAITSDYYAYLAGIRQFDNPEETDINIFATPGIDYVYNNSLVDEALDLIEEERGDALYVLTTPDKPWGASDSVDEMFTADDAVDNLEDSDIDSSYACTYYPWVRYLDTTSNTYVCLPPTKDVVRNLAQTDNVYYPWFAPAGLYRGDVDCVRAKITTKQSDEDTLYDGRINPVKTFSTDGVKIWGQKDMLSRESRLNRINVRRLLLRVRKLVTAACRGLIFSQNDNTLINSFKSIVTPILNNIKNNRGFTDYKLKVQSAESVENSDCHELNCQIALLPTCALEYISLDFVITQSQVQFDEQ